MLFGIAGQPDWAIAACHPFDVSKDDVYTRKYEGVAQVAPHLHGAMYKRNQALWDKAGVTQTLKDAADKEAKDIQVTGDDMGPQDDMADGLTIGYKTMLSWRVGMPEAVLALAEYITE